MSFKVGKVPLLFTSITSDHRGVRLSNKAFSKDFLLYLCNPHHFDAADVTFKTRCAARRALVRGACPALVTEAGAQLQLEESNEGPEEEEERDSQAPEGLPF